MRKRLVRALLLGAVLVLAVAVYAPAAFAHGERAQEGFLRMKTAAFFDVEFSSEKVKQGEQITITGKVKILETWPTTLGKPEVGYINILSPGPSLVMKERTINGRPTPGSIFIEVGQVYDFSLVLEGRRVGRWHIHPTFYVEDSGGLIGPGLWVTVDPAPAGYQNMVTLANGEQIDLEQYGKGLVNGYLWLGLIPGVIWMLWWTLKHRTVTNLAVTSQIGLNDPGEDIGLITKADHKVSTAIAAATLLLLVGGYAYVLQAYPNRIPLQVLRFDPPKFAEPARFAEAKAVGATFDPKTNELVVETEIKNLGNQPLEVTSFTTSNMTFQAEGGERTLAVQGARVEPGQTGKVTLVMKDPIWTEHKLIPIGESQLGIAGLLFVKSGSGRNWLTLEAPVIPTNLMAHGKH